MENDRFTGLQTRVLTVCFLVYFCAYIGRLNMSACLGGIMDTMRVNATEAGILQTVFAVVYACGQFVFGSIVDHIQPKRLILLGLVGSAASNASFFFANSFPLLCMLWALNGVFQSMLWTPIVRLLAANFEGERRRRASFTMSFTLAGGHIAAWGLAELMQRMLGWRYAFLLPAFVLLLAAATALFLMPVIKKEITVVNRNQKVSTNDKKAPVSFLFKTGLLWLLLCSMTNGFLRDGVITWAPTILDDFNVSAGAFKLIIPVINLFGILCGSLIVKKFHTNIRKIGSLMILACFVPSALLSAFPNSHLAVIAFMLGLMSAILYGSNTMFTVLMPMEYDKAGRVGLAAGLIDSFIYLGSALAGTFTGFIRETTGNWQSVYVMWMITAVLGAAIGLYSVRGEKKL